LVNFEVLSKALFNWHDLQDVDFKLSFNNDVNVFAKKTFIADAVYLVDVLRKCIVMTVLYHVDEVYFLLNSKGRVVSVLLFNSLELSTRSTT
jgi:hypothetical protein